MPVHGTVIVLDPDIPPQSRQAAGRRPCRPRLAWRMDGKPWAGAVLEWLPGRAGTCWRVDAQGLLDTVRFEVRGAGVAPGAVPGTASKPR